MSFSRLGVARVKFTFSEMDYFLYPFLMDYFLCPFLMGFLFY